MERPFDDPLSDGRAAPMQAAMGQPETRRTLYRRAGPKGELRLDGEKRRAPTCGGS